MYLPIWVSEYKFIVISSDPYSDRCFCTRGINNSFAESSFPLSCLAHIVVVASNILKKCSHKRWVMFLRNAIMLRYMENWRNSADFQERHSEQPQHLRWNSQGREFCSSNNSPFTKPVCLLFERLFSDATESLHDVIERRTKTKTAHMLNGKPNYRDNVSECKWVWNRMMPTEKSISCQRTTSAGNFTLCL